MPHPTDVHPPLAVRLQAIGVTPVEVSLAALVTQPSHPAATLLEGYEAIERDLSEVEHRIAATVRGGADDAEIGAPAGLRR
jgi:hypothetical protein